MDQELKQRLIGAAVITALAAIFVPMLFDDPIDETGKNINELKIPELPAKAQEVEIMPLPEKVDDVATAPPVEKPQKPQGTPAFVEEPVDEAALEAPRPKTRITAKETAIAPRAAQVVEPDMESPDAEELAAQAEAVKSIDRSVKPVLPPPQPVATPPVAVKAPKPVAKPVETKPETMSEPPAAKTVAPAATPAPAGESATTRWYLNAGSFSQKANAVTLLDNLKQQGFPATIKETSTEKGTVYKVRVGPMLDKAKAQATKSKLAQINVNSFVSGEE